MSNSALVDYTCLSPNNSGKRTHDIDRITPHCVVGQCSVERLGQIFLPTSRQASCNYGIGSDGRVGMYCEEANRSWCSSSNANDQRAVTIECASDNYAPYAFNDVVWKKLIVLCADICQRNGKKKLLWIADKNKALAYTPAEDEMLLTVHRWFAAKSCPGDWCYNKLGELASTVTAMLSGGSTEREIDYPATESADPEKTWNFLLDWLGNEYGVAGLMGNLHAESTLRANNLQNSYENKLGMDDATYTKAVDTGIYTNFVKDSAGYGLAQWTYWSRKQALLAYAEQNKASIGNLDMQHNFLKEEMEKSYGSVLKVLKSATSIAEASNAVLTGYEKPADQSDKVKDTRAQYGQMYYDQFHKEEAPVETNVIYYVQVGAYKSKANAEAMCSRLKKSGYSAIIKTN